MMKADIEAALAPLAALKIFGEHNVQLPDPIFEMGINVNGEGRTVRLTFEDVMRASIALDFLKGLDESKQPELPPQPTPTEGSELPPVANPAEPQPSDVGTAPSETEAQSNG